MTCYIFRFLTEDCLVCHIQLLDIATEASALGYAEYLEIPGTVIEVWETVVDGSCQRVTRVQL